MMTLQRTNGEQPTRTAQGNGFFAAVGAALRTLGELRTGVDILPQDRVTRAVQSEIFARAVCENSNSAMDWLYYAAQLRDPGERRYCVARALEIDPENELVRTEIRRLR